MQFLMSMLLLAPCERPSPVFCVGRRVCLRRDSSIIGTTEGPGNLAGDVRVRWADTGLVTHIEATRLDIAQS